MMIKINNTIYSENSFTTIELVKNKIIVYRPYPLSAETYDFLTEKEAQDYFNNLTSNLFLRKRG